MHENVPVRFGRGRLDSLGNKGLAAYLITFSRDLRASFLTLRIVEKSLWRRAANAPAFGGRRGHGCQSGNTESRGLLTCSHRKN